MVNTRHVCVYADRHGCGDREARPYICSGGPVCDLHKPGAKTPLPTDTRSDETDRGVNSNTVTSTAAELPNAA